MTSERLETRIEQHGSIVKVAISGEADLESVAEIAGALSHALHDPRSEATVVDLSGLVFADSMLLNQLLKTHADHGEAEKPLRMAGPLQPGVGRLLKITGCDQILDVAADLEAALAALDSTGS
ncbi:STAS domain-containing protein [Streptomyces sp. SID14478]|uniref:STAS domain-containing protein n=1 Tax=Streptomyces sp. SID14478 TaxID=2706073 RepID=UPI0013DB36BE|nr:STAS domain-containing protein [Streptomyces sp. SID14478]NEB77609.1 STAS domain-containing protein [Streptomyces sp. SID14478]